MSKPFGYLKTVAGFFGVAMLIALSPLAAVIQSLLATARANGFEPLAWLSDTLEKLPTWPNSRIDELLPIRKHDAAQA